MVKSTPPADVTPEPEQTPEPAHEPPTELSTERSPFFRRHPLASAIAGCAVAVVIVSGLTAWGVGAAVTSSYTSAVNSPMPSMVATPQPSSGSPVAAATRVAFRGVVDSIDGASWKVTTKNGRVIMVSIDPSTQFGRKKAPSSASDFAAGDSIIVIAERPAGSKSGTVKGGGPLDVTATRVLAQKDPAGGASA